MPQQLQSARKHYETSAAIARRGAREAARAARGGVAAAAVIVARHQAAQAVASQAAVADMLLEQEIDALAEALLNSLSFTTSVETFTTMAGSGGADTLERLAESLIQDAGRAAESVASTVRPDIWHVRYLSPPSCARCAVLAGRVYRYSEGFQRHPNCDCVMVPTTIAAPNLIQDPLDLLEAGQLRGLSKADVQALRDGADFGRIVNVRSKRAGLNQSGRVLSRRGRPTPEAIYANTNTREEAVAALKAAGYLL